MRDQHQNSADEITTRMRALSTTWIQGRGRSQSRRRRQAGVRCANRAETSCPQAQYGICDPLARSLPEARALSHWGRGLGRSQSRRRRQAGGRCAISTKTPPTRSLPEARALSTSWRGRGRSQSRRRRQAAVRCANRAETSFPQAQYDTCAPPTRSLPEARALSAGRRGRGQRPG